MASKIVDNRVNFASVHNPMPYPDFLDVQLKSFKDFLQLDTPPEERKNDGLYKVFAENFPITDTRNNFVLEFLDYYIDPPRYTIDECLERGLTYSVPLKAKMKLYCTDPDHEDFGTFIQDVFLGTIPYMTSNGHLCHQRCRARCGVAAAPLARRFLRTGRACQRNDALFGAYHPLQRFVD